MFTLLPLLTGKGSAHHGEILRRACDLVEAGSLQPLLTEHIFTPSEIGAAHEAVMRGSLGKVVVTIQG